MSERGEADVAIVNEKGMHARAAGRFVQIASGYECRVVVSRGTVNANGKSIMTLLLLAAAQGSTIHIETHGPGASECLKALKDLVESGFGELS